MTRAAQKTRRPKPGDPLCLVIAHRLSILAEDLKQSEKLVFGAILARFNERTGRCDPSGAGLAKSLAMSRATVFRAIAELERKGVLVRESYGGKSHRNQYRPNWDLFLRLHDHVSGNRSSDATVKVLLEPFSRCDSEPFSECDTNDTKRTNNRYTLRRKGSPPRQSRKSQAGKKPCSGQSYIIHAIDGGKGSPGEEAADASAERRRVEAIKSLPKDQQEAAWLRAMGETGTAIR